MCFAVEKLLSLCSIMLRGCPLHSKACVHTWGIDVGCWGHLVLYKFLWLKHPMLIWALPVWIIIPSCSRRDTNVITFTMGIIQSFVMEQSKVYCLDHLLFFLLPIKNMLYNKKPPPHFWSGSSHNHPTAWSVRSGGSFVSGLSIQTG